LTVKLPIGFDFFFWPESLPNASGFIHVGISESILAQIIDLSDFQFSMLCGVQGVWFLKPN